MNSTEAKKIPIEQFLAKLGHEPSSKKNNEYWYRSPFRENDKTPSFKVNLNLNTWYDFSITEGGTLLDLISKLYNENISDVLKRLTANYQNIKISPVNIQPKIKSKGIQEAFKLEKVIELTKNSLLTYLKRRSINIDIAKKYVKEIHFNIVESNSSNYAIAIENNVNGHEFRNIFMKGSVNGKSYTIINPGQNKDIAIFEGFIDFLSFLTDHNLQNFQSTVLILNSVNLRIDSLQVFKKNDYQKAYCFFDNDEAGRETLKFFKKELKIPIIDKSTIYKNHEDYNEYIKQKKPYNQF
jgi:hypothetical protein